MITTPVLSGKAVQAPASSIGGTILFSSTCERRRRPLRVLVTGAGRAIGRATCEVLTTAGHEVIATARDRSLLDELDVALRIALDVNDQVSVEEAIAQAGPLDVLVNNAAIGGGSTIEDCDLEQLGATLATNAIAPVRMVKAVLPAWRERGSGIIVNISSIQGRVATPLEGPYAASKHALEALSEAMHYELGHFGIRTVIIEPGYTAPGMKISRDRPVDGPYLGLFEQWDGIDQTMTGPDGRPGPESVAAAILRSIEDPDTPLRVPVGPDALMVLEARSTMSDEEFEATMRAVTGLSW